MKEKKEDLKDLKVNNRIVEDIICEVRNTIIRKVLTDMHDNDMRFDSHHIMDYNDVLKVVMNVELNEQFIADVERRIIEAK